MGVSGCPRSCVESGVKDFGVISVENGYQIYIGGNQLRGQPDTPILNLCGVSMYSNVFSKRIPKRVVY
jgi:dissimilatory sulfite reductase (desulfoviridin) alpha/beta subunit